MLPPGCFPWLHASQAGFFWRQIWRLACKKLIRQYLWDWYLWTVGGGSKLGRGRGWAAMQFQQPHRPVLNCSGAKPWYFQVGSVIGCRLPLEGETLGKIISFSQDNPQRRPSAEGDLLEDVQLGKWVLLYRFWLCTIASTDIFQPSYIINKEMSISICLTPISQLVYYMGEKGGKEFRRPLNAQPHSNLYCPDWEGLFF